MEEVAAPRPVFRQHRRSTPTEAEIEGAYIEAQTRDSPFEIRFRDTKAAQTTCLKRILGPTFLEIH